MNSDQTLPRQNLQITLLRLLGASAVHEAMRRFWGDRPLVFRSPSGFTAQELDDITRGARYYGYSNLIRLLMNLGPFWLLTMNGFWFEAAPMILLLAVHLVFVLNEFYKLSILPMVPADPDGIPKEREKAVFSPPRGVHKLLWFENVEFYRALGFERFRKFVVDYVDKLREEKTQFMESNYEGRVRFEQDTRTAEKIHLVAGILNVPGFFRMIMMGAYPLGFLIGILLWLDFTLVLLQRYHRTRVIRVLDRRGHAA